MHDAVHPVAMAPGVTIREQTLRERVQERHIAPEQAAALNDYAHYASRDNKTAAALTALLRAHALAPKHPIIISGIGSALYDAGRFEEAKEWLLRAVAIEPEYAPGWGNLGSVLGGLGDIQGSIAAFKACLQLEPEFVDARWNYAMTLLDHGRWAEAWPEYETRKLRGGETLYPKMPFPTWTGAEDLSGKTILVMGEQGAGDRILFSRYLAWLKEKYPTCHIMFMAEARDLPNMWNFLYAYREIVELVPTGIPWPKADYGVALMSLPMIHGTTPDNVVPDPGYLYRHAMKHKNSVELEINDESMTKVGICWTGNPVMKRNNDRSLPFESVLTLAELPNVVLFGLQFGTQDIKRAGAEQLVCDLTDDIRPIGFQGTAAAMLNLDLIVTNCTSVAHLAGAMGVPCWTMLCANPYWVWLRDRDDSVWYPNMKLYRQTKQNDWAPVLARVKADLAELANETSAERRTIAA